jgi:hypothetical protein
MKNILIISYYFPPMSEIGGIRLYGLAKYLQEFGWAPIVLTTKLPGKLDSSFKIIQVPSIDVVALWEKYLKHNPDKSLNTQFNLHPEKNKSSIVDLFVFISNEIITYPDGCIGWYNFAISAGSKIIQSQKIDAILSSSPLVTSHRIAKNLSESYHIPWIADFRDLWTQNHYYHHSQIRKFFETHLEVKTINKVSAITTVSEPLAKNLSELHKNKMIYSIPNGFDPEQINQNTYHSYKFSISYTGYLYEGKRDPEPLFRLIKKLFDEKSIEPELIQLSFYGRNENWLKNDVKKYNLDGIVHIHNPISREESIKRQRESQILLLLTWNDPSERGVYTGKLFDYLAARRPILSLGYTDGGVVKELLDQTKAGVHCATEEELRDYLLQAYHEYKELGAVQYHGIEEEIMKYSHVEMARKFAEVLEMVVREK